MLTGLLIISLVNGLGIAIALYGLRIAIEMMEENAHAINDVWNHVSGNPEMSIDKE